MERGLSLGLERLRSLKSTLCVVRYNGHHKSWGLDCLLSLPGFLQVTSFLPLTSGFACGYSAEVRAFGSFVLRIVGMENGPLRGGVEE